MEHLLKVDDTDFVFWLVISLSLSEDVIKLTLIFVFRLPIRIKQNFVTVKYLAWIVDSIKNGDIQNFHLWKWTVGDNEIGYLPKTRQGMKNLTFLLTTLVTTWSTI